MSDASRLICLCFPMPLNFVCVSACVQYRLQCVGVNPYIMRRLMDITPKFQSVHTQIIWVLSSSLNTASMHDAVLIDLHTETQYTCASLTRLFICVYIVPFAVGIASIWSHFQVCRTFWPFFRHSNAKLNNNLSQKMLKSISHCVISRYIAGNISTFLPNVIVKRNDVNATMESGSIPHLEILTIGIWQLFAFVFAYVCVTLWTVKQLFFFILPCLQTKTQSQWLLIKISLLWVIT